MSDSQRTATGVRWSVRTRILAAILAVTALGLAVSGGASYLVQRGVTLREIDDRLESRVESARAVVTGEATSTSASADPSVPKKQLFADTNAALASVLSHVPSNRNESAVGIVDGRATWEPGTELDFHVSNLPGLIDRITLEEADGRVKIGTYLYAGEEYRYIAAPLTIDSASDSEQGIYVAVIDMNAELDVLGGTFAIYAFVAFLALLAVGLVGWFVAGRALRPIRQLRSAASRITASDLSERIPVTGTDDVSELTETVNDMLSRLDGAMTSQRQLLDDVRHELKTPITIVRGHLEVLDPANLADVEATRALAIDELDRMAVLVDDIESLAETQLALTCTRVDVATLTSEVFAKASVIAGHDWVLVETADATVAIDAGRVTQAWLQLADNAAKYSPEGTTIELGSIARYDTVEFWVRDSGAGIAPEAVERIFERFGRVDSGRGIRGSGLGLPIVKAIALAHGGTVSLTSSSAGSRFGIVVPSLVAMNTEEIAEVTP